MNKEEINKFIQNNIKYKDWHFVIGSKGESIYLQIQFLAPDNITGIMANQHCRKWLLSEFMTVSEIVETVWTAVQRAELHEAAELFKYKNHDIYSRHINVDKLVELHQQTDILDIRK